MRMITGVLWVFDEWRERIRERIALSEREESGPQGSLSFRLRLDGSQSCKYLQNTNSKMTTNNNYIVANV